MWGPDIISDYITVRRLQQQLQGEGEEELGWLNFVPVPSLLPLLSSHCRLVVAARRHITFQGMGPAGKSGKQPFSIASRGEEEKNTG